MLLHETDKISVDLVLLLVDAFLTETRDEFATKWSSTLEALTLSPPMAPLNAS